MLSKYLYDWYQNRIRSSQKLILDGYHECQYLQTWENQRENPCKSKIVFGSRPSSYHEVETHVILPRQEGFCMAYRPKWYEIG